MVHMFALKWSNIPKLYQIVTAFGKVSNFLASGMMRIRVSIETS